MNKSGQAKNIILIGVFDHVDIFQFQKYGELHENQDELLLCSLTKYLYMFLDVPKLTMLFV